MKHLFLLFFFISCLYSHAQPTAPSSEFIKIDQFGYLPNSSKKAVISNPLIGYNAGSSFTPSTTYEVRRWDDHSLVYLGVPQAWNGGATHDQSGDQVWWLDFTTITESGSFYILDPTNNVRSYPFEIRQGVYKDVLKAAVRAFYYQRCNIAKVAPYAEIGWEDANPAFSGTEQDTDCRLVSNPVAATSKDLSGGWFDAGDYNKYINFADEPIHHLLNAFEQNPTIWTDDYDIPESGNGIPDLLDEIKWELDWFLKMQLPDGSFLHKISTTNFNSSSPPSADTEVRRYAPATASATRSACGALAHAAIVYQKLSDPAMQAYAETLETAAVNAWNWINANSSTSNYNNAGFVNAAAEDNAYDQEAHRICAAIYLFGLTGDTAYRDYFDANWPNLHLYQWWYAYVFESFYQNAALYYTQIPDATPAVIAEIRGRYESSISNNAENFSSYLNQTDAYMAYMTDNNHVWGNNRGKAQKGIMFQNMAYYGINPPNANQYTDAAEGYLHYIHGVNPLNLTFLTNMGALGAENSASTMYHSWFVDGHPDWDQVGVSTYGPAPGFLTGGCNPSFSPDPAYTGPALQPPQNQPILKSYLDWNTSWPQNSWEITEPSITYQAAYIQLLSNFACPKAANAFDIQVSAYLEGPYNTTSGEMATELYNQGLLPGMTPTNMGIEAAPNGQPYYSLPWSYAGQEGYGMADDDYSTDVVDWVLVSLRTSLSKSDEVFRTAGLVHKDGSIALPHPCLEVTAGDGPFYIVVEHRNHLPAISQTPIAVTNGVLAFDFRNNAAYSATETGQVELTTGVYGLWSGDLDANNEVDALDRGISWNERNKVGYFHADANLDGMVDALDRGITWNRRNTNGQVEF